MRRFSITALEDEGNRGIPHRWPDFAVRLIPLWWLATRDHALLSLNTFSSISSVFFPGRYGVFLGWDGPRDQTKILAMWIRALAQNAFVYTILGFLVVIAVRSSAMPFGEIGCNPVGR